VQQLYEEAHARHVFVVEQTGKEIVSYGDLGYINVTDLVALLVNKMLASRALAISLNLSPFTELSFEGRHWGAHFSFLNTEAILMVVFDDKTNIDLVNLRVRRLSRRLAIVLQTIPG
jgi:predicted regulator of Ras-like GTPase activity (Roadblock/LC7/MglB family)